MNVWWVAFDRRRTSYSEARSRQVVAQGWPRIGDLGAVVALAPSPENKEEFQDHIRRLVDEVYGPSEITRAPTALWNLFQLQAGDLVVALEGRAVKGIARVSVDSWCSYSHDPDYHYSQTVCFPIRWHDWTEELGPKPTAPSQSVLGLRKVQKEREIVISAWETLRAEEACGLPRVFPDLCKHFDKLRGHEPRNHYQSFVTQGVQLEGWFKGEILVALDRLKTEGSIADFDREVPFASESRRRVDIEIDADDRRDWVELKYWLVGEQRGTRYGPLFYATDGSSSGIIEDVRKLRCIASPGRRWLLLLCVANPGTTDWHAAIEAFVEKFEIPILSCSEPRDFSEEFFLGLVRVPDT